MKKYLVVFKSVDLIKDIAIFHAKDEYEALGLGVKHWGYSITADYQAFLLSDLKSGWTYV